MWARPILGLGIKMAIQWWTRTILYPQQSSTLASWSKPSWKNKAAQRFGWPTRWAACQRISIKFLVPDGLPCLFKISKALGRDFFKDLSERLAIWGVIWRNPTFVVKTTYTLPLWLLTLFYIFQIITNYRHITSFRNCFSAEITNKIYRLSNKNIQYFW